MQTWAEWTISGAWVSSDTRTLPLSAGLLRDVLGLVRDPDVDGRRLMRLVSRDQAIAARILRMANVAATAPMTEITTIEMAVVRLGTQAVRRALLSACFASWAQPISAYGNHGLIEVEHGVITGSIARYVAVPAGVDADESFAQGLLHDIGKLFLLKLQPEYVRRGGVAPDPDEVAYVMTTHHAEIGGMAMQLWGLPVVLREPIRWHHDPLSAPTHPRASAVTYVANRLAHRYKSSPLDTTDLTIDPVYSALGLKVEWLADFDTKAALILEGADKLISIH